MTTTTCPACGRTVATKKDGGLRKHGNDDGGRCNGVAKPQHLGLPFSRPPLSLNDRRHWAAKARITREIRTAVAWLARARLSPVESAIITLHYRPRDARRRDADNLYGTVKPCLDGLRDAGIIRDDSADVVIPQVRIHDPEPGMPGTLWLTLEPRP